MEARSESHGCAGRQLPSAIQLHILSLLPPNDRALSGRLVSPEARDGLGGPQHCTACLSQPLPSHAVAWAVAAGQDYVRQLPLWLKRCLMCTAVASGCEVNLQVALAALQPSYFSKRLYHPDFMLIWDYNDAGIAAVKAGHPQLLGWLLRHCPGLLNPPMVLQAAARQCDLAGLQVVYGALQDVSNWANGARPTLGQGVLDAAAGSVTPDAVAKMQWVLEAGKGSNECRLADSTAEAAARSGHLGALRWMWERGFLLCSSGNNYSLPRMLGSASLVVAQWLVDEAGCELPAAWPGAAEGAQAGRKWEALLLYTVQGLDAAAKLTWLQERGAHPLEGQGGMDSEFLTLLAVSAAEAGNVDVLRPLLLALGPGRVAGCPKWDHAASSGSIPVMECLREAGARFTATAYARAAFDADLGMVRWLALEAGVRADALILNSFVERWPAGTLARSRDLLEAVHVLVGAAGCTEWASVRGGLGDILRRGDMALTQFVLGQATGRPSCTEAAAAAVLAGNEALLEWTVQQLGCMESRLCGARLYVLAAKKCGRGTLAALRRLGVPWGAEDVVVRAVRERSCMAAVRWLVEQGAPVGSREGMEEAIGRVAQPCTLGDEEVAWLQGLAASDSAEAAVAGAAAVEQAFA